MDALLIGGIIAQLIRNNVKILEKIAVPVGFTGIIVFIIGAITARSQSFMDLPGFYTAIDLFMGMLLLLSFSQILQIRKILRNSVLTFLGKYSYGLYVYHYIIYILMIYTIRHSSVFHFSSYLQRVLIVGPVTIIFAIIASVLSYHLYEVHFLKLKVFFRSNIAKRTDKEMERQLVKVPD
jgi:peptidoglycan/LPS O-acetylase OafA/YrhL